MRWRGPGRAAVHGGHGAAIALQLITVTAAHALGEIRWRFARVGQARLVVDDQPAAFGADSQIDHRYLAAGVDQRPFAARARLRQQPAAAFVVQGGQQRFEHDTGGRTGLRLRHARARELAAHQGQPAAQGVGWPGLQAVRAEARKPGMGQRTDGRVIGFFQLPGRLAAFLPPGPVARRRHAEARVARPPDLSAQLRHGLGCQTPQKLAAHRWRRLGRIVRVVKLLGFVNATPTFSDHPKVVNGCSDLFADVFDKIGGHARSAIGVGSLPGNITVEIEAVVEIAA